MMHTRFLALMAALGAALPVQSQVIRPSFQVSHPTTWVSFGAGNGQSWSVTNGAQQWDFGDATQYVASIEKVVASGASLGIAGTTSRVPVHVTNSGTATDADANVSQAFATLHFSNTGQFHTAFDLRAGATFYSSFASRTSVGTGVNGVDADLAYGIGYGFGYSFSPRFSVDVVHDMTATVHQKDESNAAADNTVRLHTTRLIGRIGLGG